MKAIQFRGVEKSYGAAKIIKSVDIEIAPGEFAVLVGPSGCGKSTLLRMLAGLETISGGEIMIGGRKVNDMLPKDRDIAMVFQNYALYPHMTVAENMGFSLRLSRADKNEARLKVERAAGILGLNDLLDRYPRQLSGGQRQRVAMGRAIVRDPAVFLFDEPLSNLDAKLRVKMRTEIRGLHQKLKTTVVYVTHDQIEAMTMADKIIVLDGGNVSQVGTPLELYDRPRNRFVASFIGSPSMNLLPATVADDGTVRLDDGQCLPARVPAIPGTKVELGIRPEHLRLAEGDEGFACTVEVVEPTGAETLVTCDLAGETCLAAIKERSVAQSGDKIRFTFDPALAHFFNPASGQRL
jgi:multiple sugar transport system ATP-binding protein